MVLREGTMGSRSLPFILRAGRGNMGPADEPDQHLEELETDDEATPGESASVVNGIEIIPPRREVRRSSNSSPGAPVPFRSRRNEGILQTKKAVLDVMINKQLPPEETEYMVRSLEKPTDEPVRRTYSRGVALADVHDSAVVLEVGLTFLPGADKAQVNRLEETNMAGREPRQKDAGWRVRTAASLLMNFEVAQDLQVIQTDQTAKIVTLAKQRTHANDFILKNQRKAMALKSRPRDSVTIDSQHVRLVEDLSRAQWDVQGMLIEVDAGSLWDLMLNFRHLISQGGPSMSDSETAMVLERMIEDARRLCARSPILFRMSTRTRIISSKNTRYGVDHGPMFRTLTTSKGIREIISLSASYYNSLDPSGGKGDVQSNIRPRFLQMIVLLLSLLNNDDLADLKDFLESTYGLKADRRSLELCVLKVIPLLSINPKVFLKSLVPAIEGYPLSSEGFEHQGRNWKIMIKRLLEDGYLLPGTIADLGQPCLSWIVKWPDAGFKSTAIFNHLQYSGRLRAMNDIPPIELNPAGSLKEVTVIMTDDSRYVVGSDDLEKITCLAPGAYPVTETTPAKRIFDLMIHETQINGELYRAIQMTNALIAKVNAWMANPTKISGRTPRLIKRNNAEPQFISEILGPGRFTKSVALLLQKNLAIAYKVEGRKISRIEAIRDMARYIQILSEIMNLIETRWGAVDHKLFSTEKKELKQALEEIRGQIALADQRRANLGSEDDISDEPVAKCLYPEGYTKSNSSIWSDYNAWCHENTGVLDIEAKQTVISDVRWLNDEYIELYLQHQPFKIIVAPLQHVPEAYRNDEVQKGDIALFVGQYLAIGVRDEDSTEANAPLLMTNYLRIISMEEQARSRRGLNRGQNREIYLRWSFK